MNAADCLPSSSKCPSGVCKRKETTCRSKAQREELRSRLGGNHRRGAVSKGVTLEVLQGHGLGLIPSHAEAARVF